ncbi:YdeI/OmpD-associated family protein [Paenibacillus sp. GCM10012306]|uniref:YdeI/OmpD-associated family protein n=1 Tax=Paenibacillus sp. GCM10012306 TaxID=3317342 RepID=UPI00361347C6
MYEFTARLIRPEATGSWTYFNVPLAVEEIFGTKSRVQVKGTINRVPYRGTLMPHGDGRHFMVVNKELRTLAKAGPGDTVSVKMEEDSASREVLLPDDFVAALSTNEQARDYYDSLAYSYQKEYVAWIEGAKRPETRAARIEKSVGKLAEGLRLK